MTYSRQEEEEVALLAEFLFFSRLNCFPNRRERKRRWAYSTIYICIYTLIRSNAWWWAYIHIHSIYLREWVGGDSDQITTNAPLHMMGSMLSCLITNDDEIARLPKLIIPKTFTCIGTIWKNLGFSHMSYIHKQIPWALTHSTNFLVPRALTSDIRWFNKSCQG